MRLGEHIETAPHPGPSQFVDVLLQEAVASVAMPSSSNDRFQDELQWPATTGFETTQS